VNPLYEAAMILGRAITMIDQGKWTQGTVWNLSDHKMCAVGLITAGGGHSANYVSRMQKYACVSKEQVEAMYLASDALRHACAGPLTDAVIEDAEEDRHKAIFRRETPSILVMHDKYIAQLEAARDGSDNLDAVEKLIVHVNDVMIDGEMEARQWFSDALDLIAEQLPTPGRPVVPEAAEETALVTF